jgi:hypothetical protein
MLQLLTRIAFAILLLSVWASNSLADDGCCCAGCGCSCNCQKICRLKEEEKKVEIVCWGCKCEDFCVPYCSERGCKNCDTVCEACGDKESEGICVEPKRHVWHDWLPGCGAQVYTKHKLMRGVQTKKVPSFKWVVEDLCPECTAKCEAAKLTPGFDVPAPPQVAENVRIIGPEPAPLPTFVR